MTGKFDSREAEALYAITLDGGCEEVGGVSGPGWYAFVEDWRDADWILSEDEQGFVSVDGPLADLDIGPDGYYSPSRDAWQVVVAHVDAFYGDDEVQG
jgi:hypothetical protein